MSRVLVTGSRGFIGHHLVKALRNEGYGVSCFDLKDGHDVRKITVEELQGIKYVFHLAAQAKIPISISNPEFTHDHNVNGTLRLLEAARAAKVKRVIYSASSSAYGNQETLPYHEDMKPNPLSPYALQKLVGEYYMRLYFDLYGLQTVSLRYFNVYGKEMPLDSQYAACIASFMGQSARHEPLTVFGGDQTRDFTYVGDVVRANILAMKSDNVGHGEIINIGSGKNYRIDEIAMSIDSNLVKSPARSNEAHDSLADNSLAKQLLGWEPLTHVRVWLASQTALRKSSSHQ